jgi:hypothetical protein
MSNVMNAEMLSMMVEKVDDSERIEEEACANDETCKEAFTVWDYSREVSRESEKVSEMVTGKLIEAMRHRLRLYRTDDVIYHLLNRDSMDACRTEIEVFEAVYNLSKSVGTLSDQCCNLLNPIFANSPAYQNAVKSRYDRLMENSEQ